MPVVTVKKAKLKDRTLEVNLEEIINTPGGGIGTLVQQCMETVAKLMEKSFNFVKV